MTIGLKMKGEDLINYFGILSSKGSGISLINENKDKLEINLWMK